MAGSEQRRAPRRCWANRAHLHGFTLIELTVVLVLMAILAAVVVPAMKGTYRDELLRGAGRDLAGAMKVAYSQAITEHCLHRVVLDEKARRFRVERSAPSEETGFRPARPVAGSQGRLDARIQFEVRPVEGAIEEGEPQAAPLREDYATAENTVEFYPDGTAEAKEVVLRDAETHRLTLRVDPVTARVRVADLGRGK